MYDLYEFIGTFIGLSIGVFSYLLGIRMMINENALLKWRLNNEK